MSRHQQLTPVALACLRVASGEDLSLRPLEGGLESCGVFRVTAGRQQVVLKLLGGDGVRELNVYEALTRTPARSVLPELYRAGRLADSGTYLCLEYVAPCSEWPWSDADASVAVLDQLALVHRSPLDPQLATALAGYEADLTASAGATVDLFASAVYSGIPLGDRPMLKPLERVAKTLPAMRNALARWHRPVLLHGDAHSGNVIVERQGNTYRAVLLDWGRARIGCPLEDVSSWLQSLGYWEPEVRRRHDTLLRTYLQSARLPDRLDSEFRQIYWTAAASNAMAGALRYQLAVLIDERRRPDERCSAASSLKDWLRIVRRADACWRN